MAAGLHWLSPRELAELTLRIWKWMPRWLPLPFIFPRAVPWTPLLRAGVPAGSYQMGDLGSPISGTGSWDWLRESQAPGHAHLHPSSGSQSCWVECDPSWAFTGTRLWESSLTWSPASPFTPFLSPARVSSPADGLHFSWVRPGEEDAVIQKWVCLEDRSRREQNKNDVVQSIMQLLKVGDAAVYFCIYCFAPISIRNSSIMNPNRLTLSFPLRWLPLLWTWVIFNCSFYLLNCTCHSLSTQSLSSRYLINYFGNYCV